MQDATRTNIIEYIPSAPPGSPQSNFSIPEPPPGTPILSYRDLSPLPPSHIPLRTSSLSEVDIPLRTSSLSEVDVPKENNTIINIHDLILLQLKRNNIKTEEPNYYKSTPKNNLRTLIRMIYRHNNYYNDFLIDAAFKIIFKHYNNSNLLMETKICEFSQIFTCFYNLDINISKYVVSFVKLLSILNSLNSENAVAIVLNDTICTSRQILNVKCEKLYFTLGNEYYNTQKEDILNNLKLLLKNILNMVCIEDMKWCLFIGIDSLYICIKTNLN